ncbi:hotdog family protein [Niabella hibiscisoli]|uniref:hypothetical protein n=1 Tax=Niabella hibiscisoli TaxID=1825928 RepID=UPI001F0E302D|nr:hypothetical protein [Niabella hibiscisoli]MCH5720316.1 hypothetical protein [Niabella hibiscisoli]
MSVKIYYEEFEIGNSRSTTGRTITDADIVLHAGQSGDFYPIIWMKNGVKHNLLKGGLHMVL